LLAACRSARTEKGFVSPKRAEPLNKCVFFDETFFAANTRVAEVYPDCKTLYAATIPHYTPALYLAASVLKTAAELGPFDTIIVMGPDHEGKGNGVTVSNQGWSTHIGVLPWDLDIVKSLKIHPDINAKIDNTLMQSDHAVSVLTPYIKHYFSDCDTVSILINKGTSPARLNALARTIVEASKEKRILVLASIDFSHYQTPEIAAEYDAATMRAVDREDRSALLSMNGKNLDSPECLVVILELGALNGSAPVLIDYQTLYYYEHAKQYAASYLIYALVQNE
jgi:AmmeMemoRadiSam system protein B